MWESVSKRERERERERERWVEREGGLRNGDVSFRKEKTEYEERRIQELHR